MVSMMSGELRNRCPKARHMTRTSTRSISSRLSAIAFWVLSISLAIAISADFFLIHAYKRALSATTPASDVEEQQKLFRVLRQAETPNVNAKLELPGLKIAWLMSFPNSGTSFTSRLVRDATKTNSGSNYADETPTGEKGIKLPIFEDQPDGPFWIKPEASPDYTDPSDYILTKTHCGIRCTMCPPEKYSESTFSFRRQCLKTKWVEVGADGTVTRKFSDYSADRVKRAIHLIRDPFDNVVSRFHLERKLPGRKAAEFPKSREGFRSYCSQIDGIHTANENRVTFLDEGILSLIRKVPCHADFLRYIEWHNLAFVTTRDLDLETFVLHYEWYTTRFNETAAELLQFLNLEMHEGGELTPFKPGKVYPYFTEEEKQAVKEAFKLMSSPRTWEHMKCYFEKIKKTEDTQIFRTESKSIDNTPNQPRVPLDSLVQSGSKTEITGDVQFLMDFAIVGYPKTATSTMVRWLSRQTGIQMYDHEIYHLKDGEPADMVRKLYALPEGEQFKRGYKAPRDIHNPKALEAFSKFWPQTKLIVGLRHPVLWFESFYNFRIRFNFDLPHPNKLIGNCPPGAYNVCTEEIRYHDHLSLLGMTDRRDPSELQLLSPVSPSYHDSPKLMNPIFLYEIGQLHDTDPIRTAQFREDLKNYLCLQTPIDELTESKESHSDHPNKSKEIDICSPDLKSVHDELMKIAHDASIWIRKYFLQLPNVHVSSPDHFNELLQAWLDDPCDKRKNRATSRQ